MNSATPRLRQHLVVLVSADCPGCGRAREVADEVRREVPTATVEVVDVDEVGVPAGLPFLGTPSYVYNDRVISLGNPATDELVTILAGARR